MHMGNSTSHPIITNKGDRYTSMSEGNNTNNNKDVSMVDIQNATANVNSPMSDGLSHSLSQMNIDGSNTSNNNLQPQHQQSLTKHKSTLIFNDDDDDEIPPYSKHDENAYTSDSGDDNIKQEQANTNVYEQDQQMQMEMEMRQQAQAQAQEQAQAQQQAQQAQQQQQQQQQPNKNVMVPVDITWQQGGNKVYVTGSFTGWRKMVGLVPVPGQKGVLHVKLQLPPGTHKFRFIVDNELRFSDYLPTATDQMGNFVNYLEAIDPATLNNDNTAPIDQSNTIANPTFNNNLQQSQPAQPITTTTNHDTSTTTNDQQQKQPMSARSQIAFKIEREPDDMGNGFTRYREERPLVPELEYTQDIPAVFTDPTVMEQYYLTLDQQQNNHQNMTWLTPPHLPPQLENVILNNYSNNQGENNQNNLGALPIPNHVVLNHLATSSIKHNTLCVASIVRYKRKYVTQILYAPLQ